MVILGSVVLLRRMLLFVRMLFHCRMLVTVVAILLYGNVPTIPPPRRGYALILWEPDPCSIVSDSGVVVACSCVSRHVSNTMLHVWVRPTTISILWRGASTQAISYWTDGVTHKSKRRQRQKLRRLDSVHSRINSTPRRSGETVHVMH